MGPFWTIMQLCIKFQSSSSKKGIRMKWVRLVVAASVCVSNNWACNEAKNIENYYFVV